MDLLTSAGRASLMVRRDRGLSLLAREVLLGPEAWGRNAPADVPDHDPDLLWEVVEARTRLPHR
jgi:hypothetical protein